MPKKIEWQTAVPFLIVILFGWGAWFANGRVYSAAEAVDMISALSGAALYLGAAIATSSATTLALMLTMVGLVKRLDHDFDKNLYQRVAFVSRASAFNLAGSVMMLMLLSFPIEKFDNIPAAWFSTLFTVLFAIMVLLCASTVAIIFYLLRTIEHLIAKITPGDDV